MFQAPQEVNGNLFFFPRGGAAGINRHDQHIPKVDKLSQIKSCLQEGIWGIMVQWQFIYLWPHFVLAEVIITLPPRGGTDCKCVCACVCLQYLHEAAAFSFRADKKPRGDTGDLKTRATQREKKCKTKEGERLQEMLNEAFAE